MKQAFHLLMYKAFQAQRNKIRPFMNRIHLTSGQPKVLNYLQTHGACNQRELAQACDIEPATISRILDNMENNELITRSAVDKRSYAIAITHKGEEALGKWLVHCHKVEDIALKDFSEVEKQQFRNYLERMYVNLNEHSF